MTTIVETRLGDRLDLLAGVYLKDSLKWEQITALNPGINLTAGLYLEPGLFIEIPALMPEKIPDLLPWNDQEETQIFEPVEVPPDVQPGAEPDEILSGSGWLSPEQIKALLQIPNYTFPLSVEQGGTNATTAGGARNNIGAIGTAELTAGLATKADSSAVTAGLALKADASAVSAALALKVDTSTYTAGLSGKVDTATYTSGLALKVDTSVYTAGLALKADASAVATALGLKVDTATYTAGLALKLDTSVYTAGIALKLDTSTYTTGIALKLDATARNAANGVAGLDSSSLISTSQIPLSLQFILQPRSNTTAIDFNAQTLNHGSIKWIDSTSSLTNNPSGTTSGTLLQYDPLFGVSGSTGLYKQQIFNTNTGRVFERSQNNSVWGSWLERAYLNKAETFTALQDFGAGATFKGGGIPPVTTTMTQEGVDASGNPRVWLVNAAASTGNRLKSITVASNGNVQIRHHADDGTDGNVLEHTASGNVLTNGTVRPGNGGTSFTGASFVYGSTYYRTDAPEQYPNGSVGNTLITTPGVLTVSNGERWVRVSDGTDLSKASKIIVTGQLPASIAANTYTNFGTFNGVGKDYIEEVYAVCVYLHFSDGSNLAAGHWQIVGSTIASFILWKAGGTQVPVTMRMEGHNEADFTCSLRLGVTNVNRVIQLAFDKALTFSVVANSYYRITFKRLI